jgi:hypothetical protein
MEKLRQTLVTIGGLCSLLWGLFHISFWILLDWKNELIKLAELNSNVMQMLNIGIVVFLLSFGFILLVYRKEILNSALGRAVLVVFALFWLARLVGEFVFPGGSLLLGLILLACVLIYLIPALTPESRRGR